MSSLDDEIAAARERARAAEERQQTHEEEKATILRDAAKALRPFGDDVFVLLGYVPGRIRSIFAEYRDDQGLCYKVDTRRRCWIIDWPLALLIRPVTLGQIDLARTHIRRHGPPLPYREHLSVINPLSPDHEPSLDELKRQLADTFVRYEKRGRRWTADAEREL